MTPRFKGNLLVYSIFFIIFAVGFSDGYGFFKKEKKCGVIIKKLEPSVENVHKSTSTLSIEREFVMKYDDGEITSVRVSSATYYSYKENERCCFDKVVQPNFIIIFCLGISYILIFIYGVFAFLFLSKKIIYNSKDKLSDWFIFDF